MQKDEATLCLEYYILPGIATFGLKLEDICENMVVRDEKLRYNKKKARSVAYDRNGRCKENTIAGCDF